MFSFADVINLPMVWGALIAVAVLMYILLDGFDLGVGILFPFAPSDECRDKMMQSIAPFWDGNETWLILGGGGLFAAFPLAYAIMMPALYIPIMIMLLALIFRGVAFEFRFKAERESQYIWDNAFHFGSLLAAFSQGVILGGLMQGITVTDREFSGGAFDWLSAFSITTGVALVFGYALLGATWLNMKTTDPTQVWAKKCARYVLVYVLVFMGLVSLWMPFQASSVYARWYSWPNILLLSPIPFGVIAICVTLLKTLQHREYLPFILAILLFLLGYIGLIVGIWPWVIPYAVSFADAAAAPESQSFLLVGAVLILPIILAYTGYCYYVFRGKAVASSGY